MKPVAFAYERPRDAEAAAKLLGEEGLFVKAIAGGQSLGPMLNLRLAQPDLLVDLASAPELVAVEQTDGFLELGACVTHADIEDGRIPDPSGGLMPFVAAGIAYRAVRNRGTLGGSLAHADPAADWITVLPLLGAQVVLQSRHGRRNLDVKDLMTSSFTTAVRSDELIRAIRIPTSSKRARWGFFKFNQKAGEFAHAIGAIFHDPENERFRAAIGAIETKPIVIADASSIFDGPFGAGMAHRLNDKRVIAMLDKKGVNDDYHRRLALVALKRAALQASQA